MKITVRLEATREGYTDKDVFVDINEHDIASLAEQKARNNPGVLYAKATIVYQAEYDIEL